MLDDSFLLTVRFAALCESSEYPLYAKDHFYHGEISMPADLWLPFPIDSEHRGQVETLVCGKPMSTVPIKPLGTPNLCYWNVRDQMAGSRGSLVLGWQVLWIPNQLVQLHHHGIWQSEDGNWLDVTPPSHPNANGSTTFIADDSETVDLEYSRFIPNRFFVIREHPMVQEIIKSINTQININRAFSEIARALDLKKTAEGNCALPLNAMTILRDRLNISRLEYDEAMLFIENAMRIE